MNYSYRKKMLSGGTGKLTAVISFSIDYETLEKLSDIMVRKKWSRSASVRILLKYGIIYMQMLEEGYFDAKEVQQKSEETAKST